MSYRQTQASDMVDVLAPAYIAGPGGLGAGFLSTVGSFLTNAIRGAVKGATVTINTPAGPVSVPLDDPTAARKLLAQVTPTIRFGQQQPTGFVAQTTSAVSQLPGGWATVAAAGAGIGLLVWLASSGGGRRRAR